MAQTLRERYGKYFEEIAARSRAAAKINEENIYQPANLETRKYMDRVLDDILLPGSGLRCVENFKAFYDAVAVHGKSGLILMEHYTNLDLPEIIYFMEHGKEGWQKDFASRIVAVAGMKLNESSPYVRAFAEGFTRVVIYPTRSLIKAEDSAASDEQREEEERRARKINLSAMRAVSDCKKRGQMILVFPSGTRYRPGEPDTRRGLREVDSYIRLFDVMTLVSINGNCLRINKETSDDMLSDFVTEDKVTLTASAPVECKPFRKKILESLPPDDPDPKQKVIDRVMDTLLAQHEAAEKSRVF